LCDFVLQRTGVCQHQQAFAVKIESTGYLNIRDVDVALERCAAVLVGELRENVAWFVEQYYAAYGVSPVCGANKAVYFQ